MSVSRLHVSLMPVKYSFHPLQPARFIFLFQSISSIAEGADPSSTEEPMQTDEMPSGEAVAAEAGTTAMETQAEVSAV